MNYLQIYKATVTDGPGFRVSLYVSGCSNHCAGCHNPESWDPGSGLPFTDATRKLLLEYLNKSYIAGLTISGGDPCFPGNVTEITNLVKLVKFHFPNKSIWMFTGYTWGELTKRTDTTELLKYVDVAVVDRFVESLRDISDDNRWRGSTNQRIVDVQKSLLEPNGRVVFVSDIPNNN